MAFIVRGKIRSVRLLTTVVGLAVVAALAAATVVASIYVPQIAIWVPIITLGLAECDSAPPHTNTFDYLSIVESSKGGLLGEYVQ